MTEWLERHQIAVCLAGLAAGVGVGLASPGTGSVWEACVLPVLGALLYATFLQVPFTTMTAALRDTRFLGTVLLVNFAVVPLVVAGLVAGVSLPTAILLGVLLTLLTPCIDYVIVFCGLAGGDHLRLLAAAPVLMLVQLLLLPVYLWGFVGAELADVVDVRPFVEAFCFVIAVPLGLAWATQALAVRHRSGRAVAAAMTSAMVPLLAVALFAVVAGQLPRITGQAHQVLRVVPIYVAFLVVMALVGVYAGRLARLDVGRTRALVFSGATRNSLVVLPLALALPDAYAITPVVVVTQTLVELLGMLAYVRVVPLLVRATT